MAIARQLESTKYSPHFLRDSKQIDMYMGECMLYIKRANSSFQFRFDKNDRECLIFLNRMCVCVFARVEED